MPHVFPTGYCSSCEDPKERAKIKTLPYRLYVNGEVHKIKRRCGTCYQRSRKGVSQDTGAYTSARVETSRAKEASIAAKVGVEETGEQRACAHHWKIDPPNGPTSNGVCKLCGAKGEFRNSYEYVPSWSREGRKPANS